MSKLDDHWTTYQLPSSISQLLFQMFTAEGLALLWVFILGQSGWVGLDSAILTRVRGWLADCSASLFRFALKRSAR
ncbi:uncharacterized protein N7483_011635 [Penicillium malachiteum]|uniref:uncharacterized protein n=1 Tax=Penicillium malachiteum TaxID=1324776 RepID=UPI002546986B|nr:uncharacterized protein N7483_011635 [Penicillium malachiteum]KAJ5714454.1 hypothetical protein N7483_011635 [Penicillium malachiteum]